MRVSAMGGLHLGIGTALLLFFSVTSAGATPAAPAINYAHDLQEERLAQVEGRPGWSERAGPLANSVARGGGVHRALHIRLPQDLVLAKQALTWLTGSAGKVRSLVSSLHRVPAHTTSLALHQYLARAAQARSVLLKRQVVYDFGRGGLDQSNGTSQRASAADAPKNIRSSEHGASTLPNSVEASALPNSAATTWALPNSNMPPSPPHGLRPLRIAQYSNVYGPVPLWATNSSLPNCSIACIAEGAFGDAQAARTADVVIINLLRPDTPWDRPPGQVWVGSYFESPDHYPALQSAAVLSQFNYTIGFRPDDDFPVFAMPYDTVAHLKTTLKLAIPSLVDKRAQAMMSVWISNCHLDKAGRLALVDDLRAAGVTVASYGRCQQSRPPNVTTAAISQAWKDFAVGDPRKEKIALSTQHAFYFAAENSKCAYYNTEKVYQGLLSGSVPVYVGNAASLKPIVPPGSVIYADDFASPSALAAYLIKLVTNQTAYDAYLGWRHTPAALRALNDLLQLPKWEASHPQERACAVCEFLHAAPTRLHPEPSRDLCKFRRRAQR